ncbi:MAG: hypothetical protein IKV40_07260 [Clostridia bacterium]|nr:hypothetical protein [Clostridia bacterium]
MTLKNKNDNILYAKACDLCETALKREYEFNYSRFLTPAEQIIYYTAIREEYPLLLQRCYFFGGALQADRRVCVMVPSYIEGTGISSVAELFSEEREKQLQDVTAAYAPDESFGITPLSVTGSGFTEFAHRHYMGSILSLGIEREVIGDIAVVGKCSAMVFACESIAPFICDSLIKMGRDSVRCEAISIPEGFKVPHEFKQMVLVAASDRVDSIVASITNLSRTDAKEYCLTGLVEINYVTVTEADKRLSPGDKISVRGYGKYIIDAFTGETRSGRARISVRKYV